MGIKLNKKESETTEFKKSTSEIKESVIDMCAVLNKHGKGELYFGVKNNGEICGQQIGSSTLRDISRAISDNLQPAVYPEIQKFKKNGLEYIKVGFKGAGKVYHAYGRAYIRTADESRLLTPEEYARMLKIKSGSDWETEFSEKKLKDINAAALKSHIKRANEAGRLDYKFNGVAAALGKLGLMKNGKLFKAAEILFCDKNPGELKCAVFAGLDKLTFLDIRQYKGCLFELLNNGVAYIKEHMNWRADLSGQRRVEIPEVPLRAVTEAVVNSLCHRDYESPQGNEIAFYKDRIEIYNPGIFPENMKPEDYLKGNEPSRPRNPLMAGILYYSKDIEKWGSGLKRIAEDCAESGVNVKFEFLKMGYHIIFYRNEPYKKKNEGLSEEANAPVTEQAPNKHRTSTEQAPNKTSLLGFCSEERTLKEIMSFLQLKHRPTVMYNYINPFIEKNLITLTRPDKPNSPKQKYIITDKGKVLLKKERQ